MAPRNFTSLLASILFAYIYCAPLNAVTPPSEAPNISPALKSELVRARTEAITSATKAIQDVDRLQGGKPLSSQNGILVAQGDSWFDYPGFNVLTFLRTKHNYEIKSVAQNGKWLDTMAYDQNEATALALVMRSLKDQQKKPRAILLSGGGNDIAGLQLTLFMNDHRSPAEGLDMQIVDEVVNRRLRVDMVALISKISEMNRQFFGDGAIPIFVHGYDIPVPDGRGYLWLGPWLRPSFDQKGYSLADSDLDAATKVIEGVIVRFNEMLKTIPAMEGMQHVHYVPVEGTLKNGLKDYKQDWDNELHPTRSGFEQVAKVFDKEIQENSHN